MEFGIADLSVISLWVHYGLGHSVRHPLSKGNLVLDMVFLIFS